MKLGSVLPFQVIPYRAAERSDNAHAERSERVKSQASEASAATEASPRSGRAGRAIAKPVVSFQMARLLVAGSPTMPGLSLDKTHCCWRSSVETAFDSLLHTFLAGHPPCPPTTL